MMKFDDVPPTLRAVDGGQGLDASEIMDPMKDGTTIIALKYKGGILLGADGRSASVSFFRILKQLGRNRGQQGF